jgi:hypothetical protein
VAHRCANINQRKADHIRINLEEDVQFPHADDGLEEYRFVHQALPELNLARMSTRRHRSLASGWRAHPGQLDDGRHRAGAS